MKAVILCGGQGTRIRDVSDVVPKPMLAIGGRPILWHIMKGYAAHGIRDFVLCLGYKGWVIKEFFLQYKAMTHDLTVQLGEHGNIVFHGESEESDWTVTLADTGEASQTGARIWNARRYLEDCDRFCMTYGDGVANVDVSALVAFHAASGKAATLTGVRPAGRFGEIDYEADGTIRNFNEKPNAAGGYINGGFMVFETEKALSYFRPGQDLNLEQEVLPKMVKDGQLGAFHHDGFWQCMDTLREYTMLNEMWAKGEAPWRVW
ncbi:MAG: glucose-1-phosphate cytidylyltransferase [Kiritimatiellae bacterium]|nr:glucose-1-phosphate cytidylyltransferase [Kiritimatiellia bacterium]MCB1103073.1 glucose-1-phosphate cytidylyltransferase [Kiritimatiellia bacterium]